MNSVEWEARGQAFLEAAEHLKMSWTDDCIEYQQGLIVHDRLIKLSNACFKKASSKRIKQKGQE